MRLSFLLLACMALFSVSTRAEEKYSAPDLPPVFQQNAAEAQVNPASSAPPSETVSPVIPQPVVPPQKKDPCAAYMASHDAYIVCQDRMMKVQRMLDARTQRDSAFSAKETVSPAPPGAAAADSAVKNSSSVQGESKTK